MDQRAPRLGLLSGLLLIAVLSQAASAFCEEQDGRTGPSLAGQIVDKKTGKPVTAFGIELFLRVGTSREQEHIFYREYRDEDGRFFIPLEQDGQYHFCVHSSRHEDIHGNKAPLIEGNEEVEVRVELDSLRTATGRVVDAETGGPVSGAIVFKYSIHIERIIAGCPSYVVHAVTDDNGEYTLSGIDEDDEWDYDYPFVAVHPDYATNEVEDTHGSRIPDIALAKKGHRISGLILDDRGEPCAGVVIEFYDSTSEGDSGRSLQNYVISGADGRYRTPLLKPGKTSLSAYVPGARQYRHRPKIPFTRQRAAAEIKGDDVVVDFGPMPHHATWRGRVIHESLLQSTKVRIKLEPTEVESEGSLEWVGSAGFAICDDDGSFEIHKIAPSRYRIKVTLIEYGYLDVDCGEVVIVRVSISKRRRVGNSLPMQRTAKGIRSLPPPNGGASISPSMGASIISRATALSRRGKASSA